MLDGLLGRAPLRARVEELEAEVSRLRAQIAESEGEADRLRKQNERMGPQRREAVAARQEAEARANQLRDRIAQLEGDLERERRMGPDRQGPVLRAQEDLHGRRLDAVLERLESFRAKPRGALTATVRGDVPEAVVEWLGARSRLAQEAAPCLVLADDAGLVSVALRPPLLPDMEPVRDERFVLEREWFEPRGEYVLALARSDLFAVGAYQGAQQVAFKGLSPRVGRRHSRGGFSQGRFEQIRNEQIADHFRRCRETLQDWVDPTQPLYVVGQREAIDALVEVRRPDATRAVDATGAPRAALEDAFRSFWSTQMRVL